MQDEKPVPNAEEFEELHEEEALAKDRAARVATRREAARKTGKEPEPILEEEDIEEANPES